MRKAVPPPHRFRPPRRRPPPRPPRPPPPRWCATANPNARPQRALARRPEGSADLHATDGKGSAGILMAASPESFPATRLSLSPMQILQELYKPTIITRPRPFLSTLQLLPRLLRSFLLRLPVCAAACFFVVVVCFFGVGLLLVRRSLPAHTAKARAHIIY